jgi:hypothetical protein
MFRRTGIKQESESMVTTTHPESPLDQRTGTDVEQLVEEYVAICNRAMAENEDRFLFRQAKKLNRALWGETNFRTLVYEGDPRNVVAEATLHFDPEQRALSVRQSPDGEVAFSWKVSRGYLEDVVRNRPAWYLEHPVRLDWNWVGDRAWDEARSRVEDRGAMVTAAAGFTIGLIVGSLVTRAILSSRHG